jgi:CRP-like cAMP-binding protein
MSRSTVQSDTRKKQLVKKQGESGEIEFGGSVTGVFVTTSTASGTSGDIMASPSPAPQTSKKKIRHAILAHIKAVRTLGRTEINTQEIADALSISVQEVNDALEELKKHGIRRR